MMLSTPLRRAGMRGFRHRRLMAVSLPLERLERRALLAATLLADVNTNPAGSSPMDMTEVDGTLFFTAQDSSLGRELYKSDGTAAGTALLKDIAPFDGWSHPSGFTPVGSTLFFRADDGTHGPELWKSDGTPGGTVLVKDIYPGAEGALAGHSGGESVAVGATLFFTARDPEHGTELWKSDGTESGTVMVKEIHPGPSYAPPQNLTPFNDLLLFTTSMPDGTTGLWRSDGTDAGTVVVKQLGQVNAADAQALTVAGGKVYFTAATPAAGRELWVTDGTEAGTRMVKDILPGTESAFVSQLTAAGNGVLFSANDGIHGYELWKSDGTAEGTALVKDLTPGGPLSHTFPRSLTAVGEGVFFTSGQGGLKLFRSDGTDAGTTVVRTSPFNSVDNFVPAGDTLFFTSGQALWKSDGTPAGTVEVRHLGSPINGMAAFRGGVVFSADQRSGGAWGSYAPELWVSDGTPGGTALLADVNPDNEGADIGLYAAPISVNGRVVFAATDATGGTDPWGTDGTPGGTTRLVDLSPNWGSGVDMMEATSGGAYVLAHQGSGRRGLWATDGTVAGTRKVGDVDYEVPPNRASGLTDVAGIVYFSASTTPADQGYVWPPPEDYELFRSDGTAAGTYRLKDVAPGPAGSRPRDLTDVGGTLFFTANGDASTGANELWKSDGTEAGTVLVARFPGGPGSSLAANSLSAADGTLYFRARAAEGPTELWNSDGTAAGTVRVKRFSGIPASFGGEGPVVSVGGTTYFAGGDKDTGVELWKTEGTEAGTVMVRDIDTGVGSSYPSGLTVWNGALYFSAGDAAAGRELWRSDGSEAGTVRVADVRPGAAGSYPVIRAVLSDRMFLYAHDGEHGAEVWQTDGTEAGTRLAADLLPGPLSSTPYVTALSEGTLFAYADDGAHGREPWAIDVAAPVPGRVVGRHLLYGNAPSSGGSAAPDKAALLPGSTADFTNVSSYTRGINLMTIDLSRLADAAAVTSDDFDFRVGGFAAPAWTTGPAPSAVVVSRGAGVAGSDRVTVTWTDNAIRNTWLRVTVKANARTGLAAPDVFYVGNLIGETGDASPVRVSAGDLARTRAHLGTKDAAAIQRYDFNRDGRVNVLDLAAVRSNLGRSLPPLQTQIAAASTAVATPSRRVAGPPRRSLLEEDLPGQLQ